MARFLVVLAVKIAVARDTRHIVQGRSDCRLDSRVDAGRLQCHAAPAANADDADALRIDILLH